MGKQKAAPKPPASTESLVKRAMQLAASSGGAAKWLGKSNQALFNEKEENHQAAIEECTKSGAILLEKVGEYGRLTPAGFAHTIAGITAAEAGERVLAYAETLAEADRQALKAALESRTSDPNGELYSVAVNALEADEERKAGERATATARAQLERYRQAVALKKRTATRLEGELSFCRKEVAALDKLVADLEAATPLPKPEPRRLVPATPEEKDFRRQVARRLVSSWLDAWEAQKPDAVEYVQSALWNVSGFRLIGDAGESVRFDGRYHDGPPGVFPGDSVKVTRPGWALDDEDDQEYVVLKALVMR